MNYEHPERCVFIGNIPFTATEDQVRPILQQAGKVVKLELKKDSFGMNKGIAFCEFSEKAYADVARTMNGKKSICGRVIRIDTCDGGKKTTAATNRKYCAGLTLQECHSLLRDMQRYAKNNCEEAKTVLYSNPSIVKVLEELLKANKLMK